MCGGVIAVLMMTKRQQVKSCRDFGRQPGFLRFERNPGDLVVDNARVRHGHAGVHGDLQQRHVQAKSCGLRQMAEAPYAVLGECVRLGIRKHAQRPLAGDDRRPRSLFVVAAERGVMRHVSSQRRVGIGQRGEHARELQVDDAPTRIGKLPVRRLADQIVREVVRGGRRRGSPDDAATLEILHRGDQFRRRQAGYHAQDLRTEAPAKRRRPRDEDPALAR